MFRELTEPVRAPVGTVGGVGSAEAGILACRWAGPVRGGGRGRSPAPPRGVAAAGRASVGGAPPRRAPIRGQGHRWRGDHDVERRAPARGALDPDAPAVCVDDLLHDREAQPRASLPGLPRDLVVLVEDVA